MAGDILLDTSVIVAHFRRDTAVAQKMKDADVLRLPLIALGELYYGAKRASDTTKAMARLHDFVSVTMVLDADSRTAEYYGEIKSELAEKGTPIPDNDIWVAAIARQHALPLAQRDSHFRQISGLELLDW